MAETIVVSGNNYSIPDQGDPPPWGTGLTSAIVAMAAAVQTAPSFMQFVNVAATPTTMVSAKTYLVTTASLAITLNLPSPAQNAWFIIKDVSANAATRNITIHRFGSENIDGSAADKVLSRSAGRWIIMGDGTNWWTLNQFPDTGLVNTDIASAAAIAYSKLALSNSIVNADINSAAAIALTKLAALTINLPVITSGAGVLTTETQLAIVRGGTNSTAALSNNRVMKSSGGAIVEAAAITANRALTSDANGIPVANATTDTQIGYLPNLFVYRRPVLQYSSATVVNLETGNLGTSGQATIIFPDGQLISDSTSGHINCNLAQVASTGVSPQSGLRTGTVTNNTWYSFYAVKANSSTAFVVIADTVQPTQANFSTLNVNFGTNSWVFLGHLPYGDGGATNNNLILAFDMVGNTVTLRNTASADVHVNTTSGLLLATTASATSITWSYASGSSIPTQIPATIVMATIGGAASGTTSITIADSANAVVFWNLNGVTAAVNMVGVSNFPIKLGARVGLTGATTIDLLLRSYSDVALGVGFNPLL